MSTDEAEVERHAGIDMIPIEESFETNAGPEDGALYLCRYFGHNRVSVSRTLPEMMSASETRGNRRSEGRCSSFLQRKNRT
jgi:hypothetical protein